MKFTQEHGKTFIFFKCLDSLEDKHDVLFLSEASVRENTIRDDAEFYKKNYGHDPLVRHNVKFALYQSAHKFDIQYYFPNSTKVFICMDEIHEILSDKRILFITKSKINNVKLLGLSATIDKKTKYIVQGNETTKIDLLNTFCPIIFTYDINQAQQDKTTRELRLFVVKHNLDSMRRNSKAGTTAKPFFTTEKINYEHLDRAFKKTLFIPMSDKNRDFKIMQAASKRARFLYALNSKKEACVELLKHVKGKTLILGQDNKVLLSLVSNAIVESNKNVLKDLADFKNGKTLLQASNKIIRQGENIPNLDNLIIHSYYSKWRTITSVFG